MTTNTLIDVGSVTNARELVFTSDGRADSVRYILQAQATDYLETLNRFPKYDIKRTTEYYIDDTEGRWFAFYNVDCFDPPFAVIRARSFETAYEVFTEEYERWLAVRETDAKDYPDDDRDYNGNGTHIDASNVQGHELVLLTVECAS